MEAQATTAKLGVAAGTLECKGRTATVAVGFVTVVTTLIRPVTSIPEGDTIAVVAPESSFRTMVRLRNG